MNTTNNEMFKLEPTKQIALDRAVQLLRAAGVQYGILLPDGSTLGGLQIVKPKNGKKKTPRPSGYNYQPIYKERYAKMQPGDCEEFELPADAPVHITVTMLSSALSGAAHYAWGKGSNIVRTIPGTRKVEVLRVF